MFLVEQQHHRCGQYQAEHGQGRPAVLSFSARNRCPQSPWVPVGLEWLHRWTNLVLVRPRQVFSCRYVPVTPTPIPGPPYPSLREFLAQEFMHALGVPTSCSLMPLASRSEQALQELQTPFSDPYDAQFPELAAVYGRANPRKLFPLGGVSQYSCSPCSDR